MIGTYSRIGWVNCYDRHDGPCKLDFVKVRWVYEQAPKVGEYERSRAPKAKPESRSGVLSSEAQRFRKIPAKLSGAKKPTQDVID